MSRDYYGGRGGSRRSRSRERGDDDRSQRPRERDSEGSSRNLSYGGEGDRGRSERGGGYGGSYGGGSDRAGGYGGSYGGGSDRVGGYGGSYGGGSDRGGGYGGGSDRAGGYGGGSDRGGGYGGGSGRGAGYGGSYGGGSDRGGGYGGGSDRGGGYGGGSDRGGGGSDRGSGYSGRGAGYGGASDRGSIYGPGGRGGRDGGFQGRGGGGGRGGKKSMADVQSLVRLIETSSDMSDNACLQIIEPSQQALQQRDGHMQNIEATNSKSKYFLPPADPWRTASRLGLMIDNAQHIVRANCFRMNPQYLPPKIFHYNIGIFRANKDGSLSSENDFAKDSRDESQNIGVVRAAIQLNPDWKVDKKLATVGLAYDGHSSLYTTSQLPIMNEVERSISTHNSFSSSDSDGYTAEVTWPSNSTSKFFVVIRLVSEISVPLTHDEWKNRRDVSALQALNVAISTFATWQSCETNPSWIMAKNKAFRSEGESYEFTSAYLGRLGYYYSLKACTSGLVLLSEVSVHCFLRGGKLIELMATTGGFRSVTDMYQSCNDPEYGLPRGLLLKLEETFKGYKVRLLHLQHRKSFKSFGPPSNHPDSEFEIEDGRKITVEQYYQQKAQEDGAYARALPRGQLQYPRFPTLNVGSKNKKILIPLELVEVIPGQSKSHGLPTEVSSNIIKLAAMVPKDRFRHLDEESKYNGLLYELQNNADEIAFGLSKIDSKPMKVSAFILPPPKLQYKNRLIEPQLKGSWNLVGGVAFKIPPPAPISQKYPYGVVVVHRGARPPAVDHNVQEFIREYERESNIVQVPMMLCEQVQYVEENINFLKGVMEHLQSRGARIVLVLLNCDAYAAVKFAADSISLPTQCVKWSNLVKPPRNYCTSLLVKINYKMGGVNHTLASRVPETSSYTKMDVDEQSFQSPPKSISWLFDEPCMMMGVDVALPEKGDSKSNILVSVVGSTDGMLGQYAAHVSICRSTDELVYSFERAMESILQAFCERNNGQSPRRILIYRAGMNENQFDQVLEKELVAFKRALDSRGYDSNYVKMAVVVGQKRHHSRFVYEEGSEAGSYLNPCVGLCIDSRSVGAGSGGTSDSSVGSITSPNMNEFYLNSHAAILGTSKTCRYTLIYDEIGLELIEIELLTFWTTHLYARCTKSISSATPIAYAYFASRRGRFLLKGGASSEEVAELSERWLSSEKPASLYFA